MQAVIRSAASAASPTGWGAPGRRLDMRTAGTGRSPSRRGGCASSRLDHGFQILPGRLRWQPTCSWQSQNGPKIFKQYEIRTQYNIIDFAMCMCRRTQFVIFKEVEGASGLVSCCKMSTLNSQPWRSRRFPELSYRNPYIKGPKGQFFLPCFGPLGRPR